MGASMTFPQPHRRHAGQQPQYSNWKGARDGYGNPVIKGAGEISAAAAMQNMRARGSIDGSTPNAAQVAQQVADEQVANKLKRQTNMEIAYEKYRRGLGLGPKVAKTPQQEQDDKVEAFRQNAIKTGAHPASVKMQTEEFKKTLAPVAAPAAPVSAVQKAPAATNTPEGQVSQNVGLKGTKTEPNFGADPEKKLSDEKQKGFTLDSHISDESWRTSKPGATGPAIAASVPTDVPPEQTPEAKTWDETMSGGTEKPMDARMEMAGVMAKSRDVMNRSKKLLADYAAKNVPIDDVADNAQRESLNLQNAANKNTVARGEEETKGIVKNVNSLIQKVNAEKSKPDPVWDKMPGTALNDANDWLESHKPSSHGVAPPSDKTPILPLPERSSAGSSALFDGAGNEPDDNKDERMAKGGPVTALKAKKTAFKKKHSEPDTMEPDMDSDDAMPCANGGQVFGVHDANDMANHSANLLGHSANNFATGPALGGSRTMIMPSGGMTPQELQSRMRSLSPMAKGGKAEGKKKYLVGEKGAELFLPKKGGPPSIIGKNGPETGHFSEDGVVVPHHALKAMGREFSKKK